jgi:hypothetical protein
MKGLARHWKRVQRQEAKAERDRRKAERRQARRARSGGHDHQTVQRVAAARGLELSCDDRHSG